MDAIEETEEKIKADTKATIRCIPLDAVAEEGVCMVSGKPSANGYWLLKHINMKDHSEKDLFGKSA